MFIYIKQFPSLYCLISYNLSFTSDTNSPFRSLQLFFLPPSLTFFSLFYLFFFLIYSQVGWGCCFGHFLSFLEGNKGTSELGSQDAEFL